MKFLQINKRIVWPLSVILLFSIFWGSVAQSETVQVGSSTVTIVLDAGHGGIDKGVQGVKTGTAESEINLSLTRRLQSLLTNVGFRVILTRSHAAGLYGTTSRGFKMRDLLKRKSIIQSADPDIVISIHQNYCPVPSKRGGIVFFEQGDADSQILASAIQKSLNLYYKDLSPSTALSGDYFILRCSDNPSVIVECGFLSNSVDEALLTDPTEQTKIATAILSGILSYI